jgi:hypothetical protein
MCVERDRRQARPNYCAILTTLQQLGQTSNDSEAEDGHVDGETGSSTVLAIVAVVAARGGASVFLTTLAVLKSSIVVAGALALALNVAIVLDALEVVAELLDISRRGDRSGTLDLLKARKIDALEDTSKDESTTDGRELRERVQLQKLRVVSDAQVADTLEQLEGDVGELVVLVKSQGLANLGDVVSLEALQQGVVGELERLVDIAQARSVEGVDIGHLNLRGRLKSGHVDAKHSAAAETIALDNELASDVNQVGVEVLQARVGLDSEVSDGGQVQATQVGDVGVNDIHVRGRSDAGGTECQRVEGVETKQADDVQVSEGAHADGAEEGEISEIESTLDRLDRGAADADDRRTDSTEVATDRLRTINENIASKILVDDQITGDDLALHNLGRLGDGDIVSAGACTLSGDSASRKGDGGQDLDGTHRNLSD